MLYSRCGFITPGEVPMSNRRILHLVLPLLALLVAVAPGLAQKRAAATPAAPAITTPKEFFGFNIGDDYQEANYTKAVAYWKKLATETDRMKMVDIGTTEMGQTE